MKQRPPTKANVKTAIRVLEYLRDERDMEAGDKISKAPPGKYWDGYVNRVCAKSEEFSEQMDNLIDDLRNLDL